jgi:sarcosine oxidase, subunit gamma
MNPLTCARRSFVYRRLSASTSPRGTDDSNGARFALGSETKLKLVDLSVLPRWGLKGRGTFAYLEKLGAITPSNDNKTKAQRDRSLIARLSSGEALILSSLPDGTASVAQAIETLPSEGRGSCYPVPRRDSHCWFIVAGSDAPRMFAKLCGVDLAADQFANESICQTSVARLSAIVIRYDIAGTVSFSILAESASAEYLWDCLVDAMAEFSGAICGVETLCAGEQC